MGHRPERSYPNTVHIASVVSMTSHLVWVDFKDDFAFVVKWVFKQTTVVECKASASGETKVH